MNNPVLIILLSLLVLLLFFALLVLIPVLLGKLVLRWSKARCKYVLSHSFSSILTSLVTSLIITGLILLVGLVFKQQWAFSGGLLIVYVFYLAIKSVVTNIKSSKRM